jgi:hypothetical protein
LSTPYDGILVTLPESACLLALAARGVVVPMLGDVVVAKINDAPLESLGADKGVRSAVRNIVCTPAEVQELDRFFRKLADHFSLGGHNPSAAVCVQAAENAPRALMEGGIST